MAPGMITTGSIRITPEMPALIAEIGEQDDGPAIGRTCLAGSTRWGNPVGMNCPEGFGPWMSYSFLDGFSSPSQAMDACLGNDISGPSTTTGRIRGYGCGPLLSLRWTILHHIRSLLHPYVPTSSPPPACSMNVHPPSHSPYTSRCSTPRCSTHSCRCHSARRSPG